MNKLLEGLVNAGNITYTENGAITFRSTLKDTLDYYYHAPAKRGMDNTQLFANAYAENAIIALRTLFYIRDVRGGSRIGERETFRQGLRYLAAHNTQLFEALVPLVPEYGRWDDILEFVDNAAVRNFVSLTLDGDTYDLEIGDSVSLLAKYMPSANTSSKRTRQLAHKWIRALNMSESDYRRMLSALRNRIGIVERLMSAGRFSDIDYARVPSRAAMIYRKAFSKRDADRYVAYLAAVKTGKTKINAATLYPYELAGKYLNGMNYDETVELQWKALPNYADTDDNAIVMADVSISMSGDPLNVAVSLAIYFAERNRGAFANYFMTFSGRPSLEKVRGNNLYEKVQNVSNANWNMNTNFQAAFDLILTTAIRNNVPQSDMPKTLFVISDMQFDSAGNVPNFVALQNKYRAAGYELPKLVFWNVRSRGLQTPVTKDQNGVYLVSGMSAGVFKAALNARAVTPEEMMLETIADTRYDAIEEVSKKFV